MIRLSHEKIIVELTLDRPGSELVLTPYSLEPANGAVAESAELSDGAGWSEPVNPMFSELIVRFGYHEHVRTTIGDRILGHNPQGAFRRSAVRDRQRFFQFTDAVHDARQIRAEKLGG